LRKPNTTTRNPETFLRKLLENITLYVLLSLKLGQIAFGPKENSQTVELENQPIISLMGQSDCALTIPLPTYFPRNSKKRVLIIFFLLL